MALALDDVDAAAERWRADPVAFAGEVLGITTLWSRQIEILESVRDNRVTNVPAGNGIGKDFTASILVPWWMLTLQDSMVVTTATTADQVEKILWGEVRARIQGARFALGGALSPVAPEWRLHPTHPKWYAIGKTSSNPNGFAGHHGRRVLLIRDEAAGIAPVNWEAQRACASGANDRILNIGNPVCGADHPFDVESSMPYDPGRRKTIVVSTTETPNYVEGREVLPGVYGREFVDEMRDVHGEESAIVQARVYGRFSHGAADSLITIENLNRAKNRALAGVTFKNGDLVRLGCDPARYGDDSTLIYGTRGPTAWECANLAKADTEQIGEACIDAINTFYAASISIDATGGYGAGPVDYVRRAIREGRVKHECHVFEVNFGASASDPDKWANRRTELWWRMRDWLIDEAAFDADKTMRRELLTPTYKPHGEGVALEPKEQIKKRLDGRSPDRADALALAISGHAGAMVYAPREPVVATPADEDLPVREEDSWLPASPW